MCIACSGPEARADTLGVEAYLAALLDVPRDAGHVSVIQTRHDSYAATLNLMDLLKAMKIPPDRLTSPGKITFELKNEKQDIWRIAGQGQYFASTKLKDGKQSMSMVTNIDRFDVSGRFEPEHGSDLLFTSNGGVMQLANEIMDQSITYEKNAIYLSERPERHGHSIFASKAWLHGSTWRFDLRGKGATVIKAKTISLTSRWQSLKLKQIKDMIRFGDRLELHASENEPLFPEDAFRAPGLGRVELRLSDAAIETDKKESGGFSRAGVLVLGSPFTDKDPVWISLYIDDYWQKSKKEEADLDAFAPTKVRLSVSAEPMDASVLLLGPNPSFAIGVNNDLGYVRRTMTPKDKISVKNIKLSLDNPRYRIEAEGSATYDAKAKVIEDFDFSIKSKDLDKVIAANAEPASRQKLNAYFQTLLYVAKGAGVSDGKGGLTWSFARHDGKIIMNGRPFTLPGAARN